MAETPRRSRPYGTRRSRWCESPGWRYDAWRYDVLLRQLGAALDDLLAVQHARRSAGRRPRARRDAAEPIVRARTSASDVAAAVLAALHESHSVAVVSEDAARSVSELLTRRASVPWTGWRGRLTTSGDTRLAEAMETLCRGDLVVLDSRESPRDALMAAALWLRNRSTRPSTLILHLRPPAWPMGSRRLILPPQTNLILVGGDGADSRPEGALHWLIHRRSCDPREAGSNGPARTCERLPGQKLIRRTTRPLRLGGGCRRNLTRRRAAPEA